MGTRRTSGDPRGAGSASADSGAVSRTDRAGKEIENAGLKTVVAFLNTDGGILVIGVDDDGNVLGIEPDRFQNADRSLLHVNNLMRNHDAAEFTQFIKFDLVDLDDKQVLCVQCQPTRNPVVLKRDGDEEFYIRVGPGSRKLLISEVLAHVRNQTDKKDR